MGIDYYLGIEHLATPDGLDAICSALGIDSPAWKRIGRGRSGNICAGVHVHVSPSTVGMRRLLREDFGVDANVGIRFSISAHAIGPGFSCVLRACRALLSTETGDCALLFNGESLVFGRTGNEIYISDGFGGRDQVRRVLCDPAESS